MIVAYRDIPAKSPVLRQSVLLSLRESFWVSRCETPTLASRVSPAVACALRPSAPAYLEHPAMSFPPKVYDRQSIRSCRPSCILKFAFCILHFALLCPLFCSAAVRVEAYRGEPFGIGRVSIDLAPGSSTAPASDDRCTVTEERDRVLYPVVENKSSRRFLRGLLGIETPLRATYYFMFRGDEPLNLT